MFQNGFIALKDRGLVRIAGPDRQAFLQNLISQDMRILGAQPSLYGCFLSAQGKFLHDFFVTDDGETATLECEGGARAEDLFRRLKLYKLRSKIEMSLALEISVYALAEAVDGSYPDPRHENMGFRSLQKPDGLSELPFDAWDAHRIRLGIPDGSRDMQVDRDTLLECNIDRINGVSFEKGCYVGQEITARMHLRHIVKKHLTPVTFEGDAPAPGTDLSVGGQPAGQMRSHCGDIGLAMIRDDARGLLAGPESAIRILTAA